ncbi:hypothetical protein GGS26DRAFT_67863 [Hypomontagnella submonticulosa]|nr:hypothetical protein GGS26DRAFT_67863 [Hypomontagnella submonticulosa]
MADRRGSHISMPTSTVPPRGQDDNIEPIATVPPSGANHNRNSDQIDRRRNNNQGVIETPLAHLTDEELQEDVALFCERCLSTVEQHELLRAARVGQNIRTYDEVARSDDPKVGYNLPVQLTAEEKAALKAERDVLFSERNMFIVILTVSLAAFLQGFVQSSINGASLLADTLDPPPSGWELGAANASPFFFAALLGCWLSLPINDRIGRRGAMFVAACLIFASSLGSAFCTNWLQLFLVRIVNGVGMGVKAVSTPILASETAVGFWRGSSILAWQLWVAFGIMIGFAFNLIFYNTGVDKVLARQLTLGAPFVPSIFLMVGLYFCPESPRYYMRRRTSNYNPQKAYEVLLRLRKTRLQALRDIYLVYKSVQLEEYSDDSDGDTSSDGIPRGFFAQLKNYASQYKELFVERRLRNALISSSIVNLAQQLCGINILAFYSGTLFSGVLGNSEELLVPMAYSLGYGAINFFFGLPAIRTIDTLGRRKWLVLTLPLMCLFMTAAALSSLISSDDGGRTRAAVIALFVYRKLNASTYTQREPVNLSNPIVFAATYSPGMGPIPFTLASESFPLSHREAGCAFAIAINLLFAGLIQMLFPSIYEGLHDGGSLGLFAGLNFLAFVLVFLLVEETKRRSLEDLDLVFAFRKRDFVRHQLALYLPWFFRYYVLGRRDEERPSPYVDLIWGGPRTHAVYAQSDEEEVAGGVGNGWNGFMSGASDEGGHADYVSGEDVSSSFPQRPPAIAMQDLSRMTSEESNDTAHR